MSPKHHLKDETLMAYCAGNCPEHVAMVIACHLAVCPICRERLSQLEIIGGAQLDELPEASLPTDGFAQLMAQIDQPSPPMITQPVEIQAQSDASMLPEPLLHFLPDGKLENVPWKTMVPGVKQYHLPRQEKGGSFKLLNIAPGVHLPHHTHHGSELTLVLKGSFRDEMGCFKRGDIADLDDDVHHQPITDTDEPCICLVAQEAPLVFKDLLPRLLQPFLSE